MAMVVALAGCGDTSERDSAATEPAENPTAVATTTDTASTVLLWPEALNDRGSVVRRMATSTWQDSQRPTWHDPRDDVPVRSVDIDRVLLYPGSQGWYIGLAARPPGADADPGLVIAYGLVFDTNGDGVADYLVGIDDGAPQPGEFRVRVTDLATGKTDEQIGPPYGFPVEFSHPAEEQPRPDPPAMTFTFLGDSKPADLNPWTVRFYAWTSATRDGQVVARDYAPDAGWMTRGTS
jgi:hypothetical protein